MRINQSSGECLYTERYNRDTHVLHPLIDIHTFPWYGPGYTEIFENISYSRKFFVINPIDLSQTCWKEKDEDRRVESQ